MLPFPHTEPHANADLAFGHFATGGAIGDNGRILRGDEYEFRCPIILGHLHTPQKNGKSIFAGTLWQTSFGEPLPKSTLQFTLGNKLTLNRDNHNLPFKLINAVIKEDADFRKLSTKDHVRYKLYVPEHLTVPDFVLTNENIVNRVAFTTAEELENLQLEDFYIENKNIDLSIEELVPTFLKSKGASKRMIDKALTIMHDFNERGGK